VARRYYSSNAVTTTLTGSLTSGATSATVAATTGWPTSYPFTVLLDPDTASEEVAEVTNVSGLTVTLVRGRDGTSGVAHNSGATVKHGVSARDFDEPNAHVNTTSGAHSLDASLWTGLGAWSSWTPTVANMTVGNGSVTAKYTQIGKTVHWRATVVTGSTTSYTSTNATFTLPVTAAARSTGVGHLQGYGDAFNVPASTTTFSVFAAGDGSDYFVTASGIASGLTFHFSGTFEAA